MPRANHATSRRRRRPPANRAGEGAGRRPGDDDLHAGHAPAAGQSGGTLPEAGPPADDPLGGRRVGHHDWGSGGSGKANAGHGPSTREGNSIGATGHGNQSLEQTGLPEDQRAGGESAGGRETGSRESSSRDIRSRDSSRGNG